MIDLYNLGSKFDIDKDNIKPLDEVVFRGKNYRITILSESLVRLEYNESGIFEDFATQFVQNRKFDRPNFQVKQNEDFLEITTKYFILTYMKEKPFTGSKVLASSNLKVVIQGAEKEWYYNHLEVRNFHGAYTSLEDISNPKKENKGLYSSDGFVTFDDSPSMVLMPGGTFTQKENRGIDLYLFIYQKDFAVCLKDYFTLTGNPPLIPRYALGNWWSKNKYYNQTEVLELFQDFEKYEIPISVLLLDKKWKIEEDSTKKMLESGFTFNGKLFPNPTEFIQSLLTKQVHLGLHINPKEGIHPHETYYKKAAEYLGLESGGTIPFHALDPRYIDVLLKLMIHPLEAIGVDFFWNDYADSKVALFALNHYLFLDSIKQGGKRGLLLARNSNVAAHRYSVLYSGRTKVSWDVLKLIPVFNSSGSNIGISFWSHDVGGHSGGVEDSELFLRYVQLGVFSPIFRFSVDEGKYYKREPWRYDVQTLEIVRNYMNLRYRLIPYLYSESYKYHKSGMTLVKPLYYSHPKIYDEPLYKNEYLFGSELFISPLTDKKDVVMNRVVHKFYVPEGTWYDFNSGKKFPGDRVYVSFFKDEDYPVFAKNGSIIPLSILEKTNDIKLPKKLEIHVFPGKSNVYKLYEDDGVSNAYKEGYSLTTSIDYNYQLNNYTVIIRPLEGKSGIAPDYRDYKIRFRNTKKAIEVITYENERKINNVSYVEDNDFVVEVTNASTLSQISINCKGKDIEIDAVRLINDEIDGIISDLAIETSMKEELAAILFSNVAIKKKRIAIRKLKKKKLDEKFIKMFIRLLEYIEQI